MSQYIPLQQQPEANEEPNKEPSPSQTFNAIPHSLCSNCDTCCLWCALTDCHHNDCECCHDCDASGCDCDAGNACIIS